MENNQYYRAGILPTGEKIHDLIHKLIENNTYWTCTNGKPTFTPKEDRALEDLGFFYPARQKSQTIKAGRKQNTEDHLGGIEGSEGKEIDYKHVTGRISHNEVMQVTDFGHRCSIAECESP